ncbi:hypothetical protein [Orrella dioscoreae]|nr:hypothetical protein [Orrella dioscoreae]
MSRAHFWDVTGRGGWHGRRQRNVVDCYGTHDKAQAGDLSGH